MVIEMKKAKFVLRAGSLLAGSAPGLFKERNYRLNPRGKHTQNSKTAMNLKRLVYQAF